jgi:hypothetical protein
MIGKPRRLAVTLALSVVATAAAAAMSHAGGSVAAAPGTFRPCTPG